MNNVIVKTGGDGNDDNVGLGNRVVCRNSEYGGYNVTIKQMFGDKPLYLLYYNLAASTAATLLEDAAMRLQVQPVILGVSPSALVSTVFDDFIPLGTGPTKTHRIGRLQYPINQYLN